MCCVNAIIIYFLSYLMMIILEEADVCVAAGEACYTDYYTLEYCEHGCCGTDITDRHCCTRTENKQGVESGTIIGCSVGGGVLLIIIIAIIILLCKYNNKPKDVHPDDHNMSTISEQTGDVQPRYDTCYHDHFRGLIHVTPGSYTKKVGLNSHVITEPCCCDEAGTSSGSDRNIPPVFPYRSANRTDPYKEIYAPTNDKCIPDVITD